MIIPQCLNILVDIIECLNNPCAVVIVLIWSRVEGSLDIDLLVALGLKARAYLKFLNILVLQVMVYASLAWRIILVVGILASPLARTGSHEASNPTGKGPKLFSG